MDRLKTYTDSRLLEMMQNEGPEGAGAFTELYDRYSHRVYAYCRRVMPDEGLAEDIFQETFFRFYKKANAGLKSGSVIGFLITIARNLCLNYKRDKKTTVPIEEFEFAIQDNYQFENEELIQLVKMAIELLEEEYREPLVLRVYNGLNYNEIGKICNTSESNARSRVHRAKGKIKTILKPYFKELLINK